MPVENVLTEQNYQEIVQGIAAAEQAISIAEMAKQAGIDTDSQIKQARENMNKLLRLKNTFFPGR